MFQQNNSKLFVGNLNYDANEDQVRELFSQYGEVKDVKIVMDRYSGRPRGFAFVRMATAEDAGKAKDSLSGQPFMGKALVIDMARSDAGPREGGAPRSEGGFRGDRAPRRDGDRPSFRGGNRDYR